MCPRVVSPCSVKVVLKVCEVTVVSSCHRVILILIVIVIVNVIVILIVIVIVIGIVIVIVRLRSVVTCCRVIVFVDISSCPYIYSTVIFIMLIHCSVLVVF